MPCGTTAVREASARVPLVNMLSVLSWLNLPPARSYSASKSAAWALTNGLRNEPRAQATLVFGGHAAFIDTEMARPHPGAEERSGRGGAPGAHRDRGRPRGSPGRRGDAHGEARHGGRAAELRPRMTNRQLGLIVAAAEYMHLHSTSASRGPGLTSY